MSQGNTTAGELFAQFPFLCSQFLQHPGSRREQSPEPWPAELAWSVTLCVVQVVNTVTGWWLRYHSVLRPGGSGGARPCAAGHILPCPPGPDPAVPHSQGTWCHCPPDAGGLIAF